jgi:hypothetical protein
MRLATNSNEDVQAHADADERARLAANDNEDAADDVEAHGLVANTNEAADTDERGRLASNDNEDAAEDA